MGKYKIYIINDTNTGEVKFMHTKAIKQKLIDALVEDISISAYLCDYVAMGLLLTKLDIVIMDIDDKELSDIIIHIAQEYEYEVYYKLTNVDVNVKKEAN